MLNNRFSRLITETISLNKLHKRAIEAAAEKSGIHRNAHRALMYIAREGVVLSQREMAEKMSISPPAMTKILARLEADGYISRRAAEDLRYNEIAITEKGRRLTDSSVADFTEVDTRAFSGFSDGELDAYLSFVERIQANLRGIADEKMV